MSENQIQNIIFNTLKDKYPIVLKEVPILSRSVDLVFVNDEEEVVSIEIKLHDWRKALQQAKDHQLVVDRSYICIPDKKRGISTKLLASLRNTGIGLYIYKEVDNQIVFEEAEKAQKSSFFWKPSRERLDQILYAN